MASGVLKMARLHALTKTNLNKQGFGKLDDAAKSRYALPLRFIPAVSTVLIVIGLARTVAYMAWGNGACCLEWCSPTKRHAY